MPPLVELAPATQPDARFGLGKWRHFSFLQIRNMRTKLLALALVLLCGLPISPQAKAVTVAEAQKQATARYPELARAGSPLNLKFVELHREASASNPALLANPNWPVLLADKAAALVGATATSPKPATPAAPANPKPSGPVEPPPADDLPYPLGSSTEAISCGDEFNYFVYLPSSLRKGAKHPVLFVMSPGAGDKGTADRYKAGAERNRWILVTSKESKNGFDGSQKAIDSMLKHVTSKLPIDKKRMYATGFSGGARMAFQTSQVHKEIAGVIACGAGGGLGGPKQIAYGLCGTNCFNRTDMSASFARIDSKESVLRFFSGKHDWANAELCDDAITHLNGAYLFAHRSTHAAEWGFYVQQVRKLIEESTGTAPMRAFMWSSFLTSHGVNDAPLLTIHSTLGKDAANKLYMKGLGDIETFAKKTFGPLPVRVWQADPKASAACKSEAKKYAGTPWEEILTRLSEDAQSF
jgi:dienelactone hydrolase